MEAIRALHEQLDDDNDGTIEPSETRDYIKVDLKVSFTHRQSRIVLTRMKNHIYLHDYLWCPKMESNFHHLSKLKLTILIA